jgi:predicted PurR-regulated permease PerM
VRAPAARGKPVKPTVVPGGQLLPSPPVAAPARAAAGGWPIIAALAAVAILLYLLRCALLPFVFAAAVGFIADPLIVAAQRRLGGPRWLIAAVGYIVLLALLALLGAALGLNAAHELLQLIDNAPRIARELLSQAVGADGIAVFGRRYDINGIINELAAALRGLVSFGLLERSGGYAIGALFAVVLTLVLIPYFMISGPRLAAGAIWLIPPRRRHSVIELLPKIVPVLRRYLTGIVLIMAYTGAVAWIGFGPVFQLPDAALLALTIGLLELAPVLGPLSSAALVAIVAAQQPRLATAALLIAFLIALRLSIDNLVAPLLLGSATRLHPVVVIAAFVCGAMLFGILGLLLAVPAAVCVKITLEHHYAEPTER